MSQKRKHLSYLSINHHQLIIQYKIYSESVTEEQAQASNYYQKHYLTETLELKKKEFYFEQRLGRVDYYLDGHEDADRVKVRLAALNVSLAIIKREKIGEFTVEFGEFYKEDETKLQFKELYNPDGECICQEELNPATGLPYMEFTAKFYMIFEDEDGSSYAIFEYRADGSFQSCMIVNINYLDNHDNGNEYLDDYSSVKEQLRLSDAWFDYYATAHLYPTGLI